MYNTCVEMQCRVNIYGKDHQGGLPVSAIRRAAAKGQSCVRLTRSFRQHNHSSVTPMDRVLFVWVDEEEEDDDDDDDDDS